MNASSIIFYLLAALTLSSALAAVNTRQLFRAAIYLLFALMGIAGIYFWLNYAFIAAVQIIVYVGGIVVLIIFSIFLTQQAGDKMEKHKSGRILTSALAVLAGFGLLLVHLLQHPFKIQTTAGDEPEVLRIGSELMNLEQSGWALPFETISILLLAALVGCIVIALKTTESNNNKNEQQ